MECATLSREGAGLAKPPKHLWRQPRTHIRIKQRFNSDTERYLCRNRTLEKLRPGLKKPRMSWPSSLKREHGGKWDTLLPAEGLSFNSLR
ncbi:hypothetical protein Q5P01_015820 [Channa striata]|uniref:Uncharacterized protein n=1 Tax=Channa striata TaxID=64152 RepID=A0AA88MGR4_CHASR|nr:hypothetical protein Q5P01_015820 [Channa striata]